MKKLFLIEDDEFVSRMFQRAFEMHEFEVLPVRDGKKAMDLLADETVMPDAIVLDVMLPAVTGYDIIKEIRAHSRFDSVPVLILTNSYLKETAEKFLELGADKYLVKIEFQPKEVVAFVEEAITTRLASHPNTTTV